MKLTTSHKNSLQTQIYREIAELLLIVYMLAICIPDSLWRRSRYNAEAQADTNSQVYTPTNNPATPPKGTATDLSSSPLSKPLNEAKQYGSFHSVCFARACSDAMPASNSLIELLKLTLDDLERVAELNNTGVHLRDRVGNYKEALRCFRSALCQCNSFPMKDRMTIYKALGLADFNYFTLLDRWRFFYGKYPTYTTTIWYNLGVTYFCLERYSKALMYFQQTRAMDQAFHQGDHIDIVKTLYFIGVIYDRLDEAQQAFEYFKQAFEICQRLLFDHPEASLISKNAAKWYCKLFKKLLEVYNQNPNLRQDIVALLNGAKVAMKLSAMKNAYGEKNQDLEQHQCAELIQEVAQILQPSEQEHKVNIHCKTPRGLPEATSKDDSPSSLVCYSPSHTPIKDSPDSAKASINDEVCLISKQRPCSKKQKPRFELAIQNTQDWQKIASTLHKAGMDYLDQAKYAEALACLQQASKIQEGLRTTNSHDVAKILQSIGKSHHGLGQSRQALEYLHEALRMQQILHTADHPDVANTLYSIGEVHYSLDQFQQARNYLKQAFDMYQQLFPDKPDHPCIKNIAEKYYISLSYVEADHYNSYEFQQALKCSEQAFDICQRWLPDSPHINNAAEWYCTILRKLLEEFKKNTDSQDEKSSTTLAQEVVVTLSHIQEAYVTNKKYQEALECAQLSLEVQKALHKENSDHVAEALSNVGLVYLRLNNDTLACESYQKALTIYSNLYKEHDIANALKDAGDSYRSFEEYPKACQYYQQAIGAYKLPPQGRELAVAVVLRDVEVIHTNLDQPEKALRYAAQVLKIYQAYYSHPHDDLANALRSVGVVHSCLKHYDHALDYLKQALQMSEKLCSDNPEAALTKKDITEQYCSVLKQLLEEAKNNNNSRNPKIVTTLEQAEAVITLRRIQEACVTKKEHQEALECAQLARKVREVLHTGNTDHVAEALSNVGHAYDRLGNYQQALKYFQKALTMQQAMHGVENHAEVAEALSNVGYAYDRLGNYQQALEYYQQALKMQQAMHQGENHIEVAKALVCVGSVLLNLDQNQEALEYYQQALKMQQAMHQGENHTEVAEALGCVGHAYFCLGQHIEALEYYQQALKMQKTIHQGENHADIAKALNWTGSTLLNLGNNIEVLHAHPVRTMQHGLYSRENHDEVAKPLSNVGHAYDRLGNYQQALKYFQEALTIYHHLSEGNDPHIGLTLYYAGVASKNLKEYDKARKYLREAFKYYRSIFAKYPSDQQEDYPDTAEAMKNMAIIYDCLDNSALPLLNIFLQMQHARYQKDDHCVNISADLQYCEQALQKHQNLYQEQTQEQGQNKKQDPNSIDVVNIWHTIGLVYATLQQFDPSLAYLNSALEIIERMFPSEGSDCLRDLRVRNIRGSRDLVIEYICHAEYLSARGDYKTFLDYIRTLPLLTGPDKVENLSILKTESEMQGIFTKEQISGMITDQESGMTIPAIFRKYHIEVPKFCQCKGQDRRYAPQ